MGDRTEDDAETRGESTAELIRTVIYALLIALVFRTFFFQAFTIPSGSMKPTLLIGDYLIVSKYSYGYSRFSAPFGSRWPSLLEGRIWSAQPERGDVAVFRNPHEIKIDYIKRVIGLPGDTIEVRRGVLLVNGQPAAQTRADAFIDDRPQGGMCSPVDGGFACAAASELLPSGVEHEILPGSAARQSGYDLNTCVYTVPDGHYFMMGDNRTNSADSRFGHGAAFGRTPEDLSCDNLRPGALLSYASSGTGFVPADHLIGRAEFVLFSSAGAFWEVWNWRSDRFFRGI